MALAQVTKLQEEHYKLKEEWSEARGNSNPTGGFLFTPPTKGFRVNQVGYMDDTASESALIKKHERQEEGSDATPITKILIVEATGGLEALVMGSRSATSSPVGEVTMNNKMNGTQAGDRPMTRGTAGGGPLVTDSPVGVPTEGVLIEGPQDSLLGAHESTHDVDREEQLSVERGCVQVEDEVTMNNKINEAQSGDRPMTQGAAGGGFLVENMLSGVPNVVVEGQNSLPDAEYLRRDSCQI